MSSTYVPKTALWSQTGMAVLEVLPGIGRIQDRPIAAFGQVDTPVQNAAGVVGAIGVTGWALDDVGERVLALPREPSVDRDVPFREVLHNRR